VRNKTDDNHQCRQSTIVIVHNGTEPTRNE